MKEQMSKLCDKLVISHISNSPLVSDIIPVWTQLRKVFLLPLPRTFKSQMDRGWEWAQAEPGSPGVATKNGPSKLQCPKQHGALTHCGKDPCTLGGIRDHRLTGRPSCLPGLRFPHL